MVFMKFVPQSILSMVSFKYKMIEESSQHQTNMTFWSLQTYSYIYIKAAWSDFYQILCTHLTDGYANYLHYDRHCSSFLCQVSQILMERMMKNNC